MSFNDVLFVIAVIGLTVTTGLKYWPQDRTVTLTYEGTRTIEDGKTVADLRSVKTPTLIQLPVGFIPEGTNEDETVEVTLQR